MSQEAMARYVDAHHVDPSGVLSDDGTTVFVTAVSDGVDAFIVRKSLGRGFGFAFNAGWDPAGFPYANVGRELRVDGLKVIGARGPAIPDADGSLEDATRAINAILAQMRVDGKIQP